MLYAVGLLRDRSELTHCEGLAIPGKGLFADVQGFAIDLDLGGLSRLEREDVSLGPGDLDFLTMQGGRVAAMGSFFSDAVACQGTIADGDDDELSSGCLTEIYS